MSLFGKFWYATNVSITIFLAIFRSAAFLILTCFLLSQLWILLWLLSFYFNQKITCFRNCSSSYWWVLNHELFEFLAFWFGFHPSRFLTRSLNGWREWKDIAGYGMMNENVRKNAIILISKHEIISKRYTVNCRMISLCFFLLENV